MSSGIFTLITGASEGLGKALALECANRKMNLILVALPGKELFQLAGALERSFQIKVAVFEKDLTIEEECSSLYHEIVEQKWEINMLINNAGLGNCCAFEDGQLAGFQQLIKLNIMATTMLTRLFIDLLKKQKKSYILNVSSLIAFFNLPNKQVYGGTKSYIYYF
ncbi:SDR family NAD(P)-dependent oxidoreductase [Flavihumibacter profundi]|uniref:SDR family NAD(P)-dependent oxidoreductase n=1 Tax=Flavihumibacter profundi TaxID=2716883 RepID=UPI001CC6E6C9|nr:SDR family NAD(P)-dependent oxidoreductase [Flavihumibacter profundi]MBZ5858810.1 SDR family NAD(P)-dependent oxidoreductase [Flavihumibacter profundi]